MAAVGEGIVVEIGVGVRVALGEAAEVDVGVALGVAVISGEVVRETAGVGVLPRKDGAASVASHPATAAKDRSNSIKEKASPFLLRGKVRMGVRRVLRIHANSTDVAPLPPRSRVSASNDLTREWRVRCSLTT